ncbi:MAG: hypothetical protein ABIP78_05710 [Pyrinomonadaceae bacterium]
MKDLTSKNGQNSLQCLSVNKATPEMKKKKLKAELSKTRKKLEKSKAKLKDMTPEAEKKVILKAKPKPAPKAPAETKPLVKAQ